MKKIGIFLIVFFPALTFIGLLAHGLMGCQGGGSSGPVSGCHIFGFEFNFIASLGTPAFVASFLSVPIGFILLLLDSIFGRSDTSKKEN